MANALDESKALLIRRWGEMGGYWGINRTMAEIHALLFLTRDPLCTDDIMRALKISRGSASMNLRGLLDWGLIRRVHHLGDRKEYFEAVADVWHMFETILRERQRREVEPIIATIERCQAMINQPHPGPDAADPAETADYRRRLDELRDFLSAMGTLFELALRYGDSGIGKLTRQLVKPAGKTGARQPTSKPVRRRRE
ncbi:MAG: MarR family transcriptional regulator [Planctomycetes bacterium]|nr:MarR family transcriptional regulator [Planctomycetota bacterium]